MFNADPSFPNVPTLTTEQIQKYLEENKELILAILEYQNLGKFTEIAQCQAKLQHNLTFLAKLADAGSQASAPIPAPAPTPSQVSSQAIMQQGQGMQQHQIARSQPQPDLSALNLPLEMNDQQPLEMNDQQQLQQLQQLHLPMSLQMNEQNYKLPHFLYQQQIIPGSMGSFPVANSGIYQASQTRLGNLSDTPSSNQTGSYSGPGWS